jgi:circadian clock protein KaiC
MTKRVVLDQLETGVPGLDTLLNGGISRFSFIVLTGAPGSGKTTLAHQIMFALANPQRKALFFTIVGEPPLKMLRYQQQYHFFDLAKVGSSIKYFNLADDLHKGGFEGVLDRILKEVENFQPELIFVDSFKSVIHATENGSQGTANLQYFVQRLGMQMASWQATTFLIGEYADAETEENPIFTVADGIIHLLQDIDQNAIVRKLRVVKMRGRRHMTGLHSFRITDDGLQVFPRLLTGGIVDNKPEAENLSPMPRLSTGSAGLDEMLNGGIPAGYSMLLIGPPGCGKTMLATAFLAEGARNGEAGILASFEQILSPSSNIPLTNLIQSGKVTMLRPYALDLSIEEIVTELADAVDRTQAKRLVIDSLSSLELALAPQFRENFQESLFRMLTALAKKGATLLMIRTMEDVTANLLSCSKSAFLVDGIISMRYAERDFKLIKLISSVKLRGSAHSEEIRPYIVTDKGITVGPTVSGAQARCRESE